MVTDRILIQTGDFDPGEEIDLLAKTDGDAGAVASFIGLVRGDDGLKAMTLEHYPGMTEKEIGRHIEEARGRWPLGGVTVIHRVGRLMPGERIVFVGIASRHREAAFEACRFLMDYLKTRAPLWKLEERGAKHDWVEAKTSDDAAAARWKQG